MTSAHSHVYVLAMVPWYGEFVPARKDQGIWQRSPRGWCIKSLLWNSVVAHFSPIVQEWEQFLQLALRL